jgi:hypothetical protein
MTASIKLGSDWDAELDAFLAARASTRFQTRTRPGTPTAAR